MAASKKRNNTVLVIGALALLYFLTRDKKLKAGKPIIEYLDEGFGVATDGSVVVEDLQVQNAPQTGRITHVGVLPVSYVAGRKRNGQGIGSGIL